MKKTIAITAGVLSIFTAGWLIGKIDNQSGGETRPPLSLSSEATDRANSHSLDPATKKNQAALLSPAQLQTQALVSEIQAALGEGTAIRKAKLLPILERSTELPLSKELVGALQEVLDAGDMEEGQYVLSLMEQREEKASVAFLVKALDHPQSEIAERALFACEAVGGTVFADANAAREWAVSWQPDPQRAALFAPKSEQDVDAASIRPGPQNRASNEKTPEK